MIAKRQYLTTTSDWLKKQTEKMTEDEVQREIVSWLRAMGFMVFHFPNHGKFNAKTNRYNRVDRDHVAGIPDLVVILPEGETLWIEVKRPFGGKISDAQARVLSFLDAKGHLFLIATSVGQVKAYMETADLI